MDSYEATKTVFSRIKNLEPENASKIMGYLLLQDHGEKEMIRLAFGPENLLHNLILQAKIQLRISTNAPSTASTPSSPSPFTPTNSRPNPFSISPSRITNNNNNNNGFEITTPSSPSSNSWPLLSPNSSLSYASIVSGTTSTNNTVSGSTLLSSSGSFSNNASLYSTNNSSTNDIMDDYQLQEHFSFLNEPKTNDSFDPLLELAMSPTTYGDARLHRSSFSVPGMSFVSEDANSGLGWKPCLYFARGFCKNGNTCKFIHGESVDGGATVGSPSKINEFEQCQELLRSRAAAAATPQFMSGASSFTYNKCMNFLLQQNDPQRSAAAAAFMMEDDLHKLGRCRSERNDFSPMGLAGANTPSSRQIYLTFPADSTFTEEEVSNYFSIYGPVQDVRIPYQQKRMFGFVTFLYPETVKLILAKGNPHFVCDSRVLVKPYKEKGKVAEKKQQQQMERGDYSACSSPSGLDSREPFDLHPGARMYYDTEEMLLRRKLEEQADLQQAIELHGRRLMNLQLLHFQNNSNHQHNHYLNGLSTGTGSPIPTPTVLHTPTSQTLIPQQDGIDQDVPKENGGYPEDAVPQNTVAVADQEVNPVCNINNGNGNGNSNSNSNSKEEKTNTVESYLQGNLEHILPDNLFTSPKKSAGDHLNSFFTDSLEADESITSAITSSSSTPISPLMPTNSTLNMTSLKSCFLQMSRFSSGHGTVGMSFAQMNEASKWDV